MAQLPPISQTFAYDADGNLTSDGIWDYVWDAENRLVQMSTTALAVTAGYPNRVLQYRYDYLGRRVQKLVVDGTTSTLLSGRRYLYDGWNLVGEYRDTGATEPGVLMRSYTWGLDIARTLTEAGGVGALLQIADHATGRTYLPSYDGNGNVATLTNASTGALAAAYEYSPYGEPLRAETYDATVADQPFRFGTKFADLETGLVYYGARYYAPSVGRFLGRDPSGEKGGIHLYAFCLNNPCNRWDVLGMKSQDEIIQEYADQYLGTSYNSTNAEYGYWKGTFDVGTGKVTFCQYMSGDGDLVEQQLSHDYDQVVSLQDILFAMGYIKGEVDSSSESTYTIEDPENDPLQSATLTINDRGLVIATTSGGVYYSNGVTMNATVTGVAAGDLIVSQNVDQIVYTLADGSIVTEAENKPDLANGQSWYNGSSWNGGYAPTNSGQGLNPQTQTNSDGTLTVTFYDSPGFIVHTSSLPITQQQNLTTSISTSSGAVLATQTWHITITVDSNGQAVATFGSP